MGLPLNGVGVGVSLGFPLKQPQMGSTSKTITALRLVVDAQKPAHRSMVTCGDSIFATGKVYSTNTSDSSPVELALAFLSSRPLVY